MRSFSEVPEPPFTIGAMGVTIHADPAPWAARFAEERAIVCRDIFDPAMFDRLFTAARNTQFRKDDIGIGTRELEAPQRVSGILNLLLQRAELFRWLEAVTGRTGLAGTAGTLMQARAGAGDALAWHDDLNLPHRALAITIGLSDATYAGGQFEMRRVGDPESVRTFNHSRPGTALIFDLGTDLEHRVLPVLSGGPRRVFGGWIVRKPVALAVDPAR